MPPKTKLTCTIEEIDNEITLINEIINAALKVFEKDPNSAICKSVLVGLNNKRDALEFKLFKAEGGTTQ